MITEWTSLFEVNRNEIPPHYLNWIEKPHILSHAIKAMANFSVEVVSQDYGVLFNDEATLLKYEDQPLAIIRQTYLLGDNVPFVFARICIPFKTYKANKKSFDELGSRPIGETLLYNNPKVYRGEFQVKQIPVKDPFFRDAALSAKDGTEHIWARRSTFNMDGHLLLITEGFLSTIPAYMRTYSASIRNI